MADFMYLHPSVQTQVNSYQNNFQTAEGPVTLFAADTFEKGKDGVIDFVGTEEEFIFKYGEPNYAKYGQTAYNMVNWLRSGGQAYVLRVLPNNATYSHAILNVQSRVQRKGKKVLTEANELVEIDDVKIRPTIAFVKKNNRNIEELVNEISLDRTAEQTVDGYNNNFLLLAYPNGRGESYNDLGIRLTLNTSYDTSGRTERVYNLEVLDFDEFGNVNVIDGPFLVTFDTDSISDTGESMFIEEVVNRYSKYINIKFNLENFQRLAEQINPYVHPASIDVISGRSKVGLDGAPETFYSEVTKDSEDVHISLQRYNNKGIPVTINGQPVLNKPDFNDPVENALISLDNGIREKSFVTDSDRLSYMRDQYKTLRSDKFSEFKSILNKIIVPNGGLFVDDAGDLPKTIKENLVSDKLTQEDVTSNIEDEEAVEKELAEKFKPSEINFGGKPSGVVSELVENYKTYFEDSNEENLSAVLASSEEIGSLLLNEFLDNGNKLNAAYELVYKSNSGISSNPKYQADVKELRDVLSQKDQIRIFGIQHKSNILDITNDIAELRIGMKSVTNIEGMSKVLNDTETELKYVTDNLIPAVKEGLPEDAIKFINTVPDEDGDGEREIVSPESMLNRIADCQLLIDDVRVGLMEDNATNREEVYTICNEIANQLVDLINRAVSVSSTYKVARAVRIAANTIYYDIAIFRKNIDEMIQTRSNYTERDITSNAHQNIELAVANLNKANSKYFNTNLIDVASPVKFLFGSDGDFSYENDLSYSERKNAVNRELIKAYKGLIDEDLTNTKAVPFDVVLDARYSNEVKFAISELAKNNRKDFVFLADTITDRYPVSPEDAIKWRKEEFAVSSEYTAIYSQDLTYYDEYTGRDIRFTPTYRLASMIPYQAVNSGLHFPIAGPRRGLVEGHKALSWAPNEPYKEKLYTSKINYIEKDIDRTKFGSQMTSIKSDGPLSNLNNIFTLNQIKRDAETLVSDYQFELNDDETRSIMNTELNSYLTRYVSNRSCETIQAEVSADEYDKAQRIVRVRISVKFNNVIERIFIDINVEK
ncbi:contractile tail sheath structural protein [Staphylococcus phage vB_StaM_PB50]|nr:contractile tail sheath structural protein [Staphylococcus phage vB_StaM_PB50]